MPFPTREVSHEKETKSHEYLKNDYTILATEVLNKTSDEGKCALLDTTTKANQQYFYFFYEPKKIRGTVPFVAMLLKVHFFVFCSQ